MYVQTQMVYQCERWKEETYVYVTETTHIYICTAGHYEMQGRKGIVWQALTDDIHSQYNTHLSEENMGRAITGRSVSRSCCGTPIPSPNPKD